MPLWPFKKKAQSKQRKSEGAILDVAPADLGLVDTKEGEQSTSEPNYDPQLLIASTRTLIETDPTVSNDNMGFDPGAATNSKSAPDRSQVPQPQENDSARHSNGSWDEPGEGIGLRLQDIPAKEFAESRSDSAGTSEQLLDRNASVSANQEELASISQSHTDEVVAKPRRLTGQVSNWLSDRNYGFISGLSISEVEEKLSDVLVHKSALIDCTELFKGDLVSFVLEQEPDGRYRASKVRREVDRIEGEVVSWDPTKKIGQIKISGGGNRTVFVHHSEIHATGPKYLLVGERVEFDLSTTPSGTAATNVSVFQSRYPLERFANIERLLNKALISRLAELAQPENWNYVGKKSTKELPVLERYIKYTFERLIEEEKIVFSSESSSERIAAGNTGLMTPNFEDIVALFEPNKQSDGPEWFLVDFVKRSNRRLVSIGEDIPLANYFDDPSDLLLDPKRTIVPNIEHIVEDNLSRFPARFHDKPLELTNAFKGALDLAVRRVQRNFKVAVPQFYQGRVQLLLPICFTKPETADVALVLSKEGEVYIGSTVLPMYVAYSNARLIAKPDSEWLKPYEEVSA